MKKLTFRLLFLISGAKVSTKVHQRKSVQRICDFNLRTPLSVMPHALTSRALAGFHVRLVFRLCSTLKRLLIHVCGGQWPGCLRAIMEFTAAGQLEILTHIPN